MWSLVFMFQPIIQMSLVTDSSVNSSSSDDFASFLDATLGSDSAESSPEGEAEDDDDDTENKRFYCCFLLHFNVKYDA